MSHPHSSRTRTREEWVCHIFGTRSPLQAHVIGIPYEARLEDAVSPDRVDHVMFTLQVPPCGALLLAVNTFSRLNVVGGFDPRIRVGVVRTTWQQEPGPLLEESAGLDYSTIEAQHAVDFAYRERDALGRDLIAASHAAVRVEAWGQLFRGDVLGLHQIHSRRASCAVGTDLTGRDGALRFYFRDHQAEMWLFKFCGQP